MNNFPLSWPDGWPRATSRKRADFGRAQRDGQWPRKQRLEVIDGVNRVLGELERLKVDRQDVIISTNVRTRLDGLPRSGEAEPKDPGAAVYWATYQSMKKVMIPTPPGGFTTPGERYVVEQRRVMAVDRYDRVADNLAAIAATLDALRAIERHGGGQILERAFTGFTALAAPDAEKSWREVLGVPPGPVHGDHVRDLYLRLRGQHHPDRHGGDAAEFNRVEQAYASARAELGI
jgi:hypothetical protein